MSILYSRKQKWRRARTVKTNYSIYDILTNGSNELIHSRAYSDTDIFDQSADKFRSSVTFTRAWNSSVDFTSKNKKDERKSKIVKFDDHVELIVIPNRQNYIDDCTFDNIWYMKDDFILFKLDANNEKSSCTWMLNPLKKILNISSVITDETSDENTDDPNIWLYTETSESSDFEKKATIVEISVNNDLGFIKDNTT